MRRTSQKLRIEGLKLVVVRRDIGEGHLSEGILPILVGCQVTLHRIGVIAVGPGLSLGLVFLRLLSFLLGRVKRTPACFLCCIDSSTFQFRLGRILKTVEDIAKLCTGLLNTQGQHTNHDILHCFHLTNSLFKFLNLSFCSELRGSEFLGHRSHGFK